MRELIELSGFQKLKKEWFGSPTKAKMFGNIKYEIGLGELGTDFMGE